MDYCCAVLRSSHFIDFFFNVTARTGLYTLSLHDALPISSATCGSRWARSTCSTTRAVASRSARRWGSTRRASGKKRGSRSEEHTSELQSHSDIVCRLLLEKKKTRNNPSSFHRRVASTSSF